MILLLVLLQLPVSVFSSLTNGDREFERINYAQAVAQYDFDLGHREEANQMFESAMRLPITAAGDTIARKVAIELMNRQ